MQEIGSGTTAVACAELGVPFIGYEIVEEYAEMANRSAFERLDTTRMNVSGESSV